MVTAVETRPGTNPDRASFTTALEAARDQLTAAAGICPDGPADLAGVIGRAVLATCCPPAAPGSAPARSNAPPPATSTTTTATPRLTAITAIDVAIRTPPAGPQARQDPPDRRTPRPCRPARHPPRADHRHHHQPAPARLERPRTRRPARGQAQEHAHPARRMGPSRLLHPHRLRHLPPQHAASRHPRQPRPTLNYAALRSDAAGALDAGCGPPGHSGSQGMGFPCCLPGGASGAGRGGVPGRGGGCCRHCHSHIRGSGPQVCLRQDGAPYLDRESPWCPHHLRGSFLPRRASRHATGSGGSCRPAQAAVISAHTNPASSRATATMASGAAFPPACTRCTYRACSRRWAVHDRARVSGAAPCWRRRSPAPIAGACR